MRPASQRFFIHSCIYLRILIISYLATNSLSVLMYHKAVNQSTVILVFIDSALQRMVEATLPLSVGFTVLGGHSHLLRWRTCRPTSCATCNPFSMLWPLARSIARLLGVAHNNTSLTGLHWLRVNQFKWATLKFCRLNSSAPPRYLSAHFQ